MERERLASITEGARERIVGEEVDRPRGGGDDETPDPEMDRTGRHHRRTVTDSEQTDGSEEDTANATYQQASSDSSDDYALLERIFGPQREPVSGVKGRPQDVFQYHSMVVLPETSSSMASRQMDATRM